MAALTWDGTGERFWETGTKKGVLYPYSTSENKYIGGVAWNGLTAVTESPSGAEETALYADDQKYGSMRSAEEYGFTIEAYTYPDEFAILDGTATPEKAKGVYLGQQDRGTFGFSYVTTIGNDVSSEAGYKLHLIYGATASPSEKAYQSINDSPEAITFSWECTTNPVNATGYDPVGCITIDSTKADAECLKKLEDKLYGADSGGSGSPELPLPDEVIALMTPSEM